MESERRNPPVVRARQAGKVSGTLESIAELFRKNNPGRVPRWVYDPKHRPDLSNVLSRLSSGYRKVEIDELGDEAPDLRSEGEVRVGDLILMSISQEDRLELEKEMARRNEEQKKSVERSFYEAIDSIHVDKQTERTRARPRGRSVIEEKEFIFNVEQEDKGE